MSSHSDAATNVALGKDASQSSIWSVTNPASYAVDGDTSSTFRIDGHCAQTGMEVRKSTHQNQVHGINNFYLYQEGPYVMIDLGASYSIDSIELWTREKNMGACECANILFR
jgi:hypothetical protein